MKWIFILLVFVSSFSFGQTDDPAKYLRYQNQYGQRLPRHWSDSVLRAAGLVKFTGITQQTDTTTYKPIAIDGSGNVHKFDRWPGSGSLTEGYGIDISGSTVKVDTLTIDARYKRRFLVTTYGADPDSNSTDDCPAIRAAMQATYDAGGGIVYFPLGHYTANCPLIRSQDGVDPRAQFVIPLTQAGTGEYPRIVFEGEVPGNFSGEIVPGIGLPKNRKGVIIESTILDTGYVFGSSFYNVPALAGDVNYTWVEFKNVEVRTRTKTAGAEISGTMSGIDMNAPRSVNFDFVKVTTQSPETDLIAPYSGTIGVRLPHVNNNAHITGSTLTVTGFYTGVICGEHMNFQEMITATCRDGLVLTPANHSGYIGQYTSEGCVNHIRVLDSSLFSGTIQPMDLHIGNYNIEHYTTGGAWYTYSSDVLYDDTSVTTNILIDYAHIAVSGVGESYVFNTNAKHKVVVGNTPIRSNYPYNRENGHYIVNHASSSTIDGNVFMNENNASGIGMSAAAGDGVGQGNGGWVNIRADNYTANAGQRGWLTIGGGSPSTPTGSEGSVSIFTNLTERLRVFSNGNTQIGSAGTDDGGLLQVGKSTNGYNVYNFNNPNTGASARQALVLRGDNVNRYLDFELHNSNAGNAATITGGSVLSEFNFISTGNYPIRFFTNSDGSSNERMRITGTGAITFNNSTNTYTFPSGRASAGQVLTDAAGDGNLSWASPASTTTLYTGDGTLAGNRAVNANNLDLTFNDVDFFTVNYDAFIQAKSNGTFPYTSVIVAPAQQLWTGYTPTAANFSKGAAVTIDTNNNVSMGTGSITSSQPLYTAGSAYAHGFTSGKGNFYRVDNYTTNQTLNLEQYFVTIDATSGNVTITLPAASSAFGGTVGIHYVFKRLDNSGNTVTIQRNGTPGTDTIDGAASFTLTTQYEVREVQCISTSAFALK